MTDRDRLIELLKAIEKDPAITCPHWNENDCFNCPYDKEETCDMEARKADYLLANGVIVPPCKVGDIVWFYDDFMWGLLPCKVDRPYHCICGEEGGCTFSANFTNDDFGKTVFLTKEDAEEKLKELGK